MDEINKIHCCENVKNEYWFITIENNKIKLNEDYSVHNIENAKYCPWCGKILSILLENKS